MSCSPGSLVPDGRHRCLTAITVSCGRGEDRRRALFPFPSHGALAFHRNTECPWSNDLPFIVGDVQACAVYAPLHASKRVLGELLTPQEAAALVVAHLPDNCGPV
ncbi:DUF6193 family natural product biosynthesis protein [Streptomyces parvus]|uniref:DUF6193 family natural product biosynthesis protein n=1 Tax=Streptomyces parvus TaxID=66428 RepID=UPI00382D2176